MRRIAEIPAVTFLSVLLFQDRCWSTVTPRVLHSFTCLICFFSIKTFGEPEIFFIIGFKLTNINSLRITPLAINHFLRFFKSEFAAASRSVKEFAEAVRFVSYQQTSVVLFSLDSEANH